MKKFREILGLINELIEQRGATESDLKQLWNSLSDAITDYEHNIVPISADVQQTLFNYFDQEHGIQLMDSDFVEIEEYMRPEVKSVAIEYQKWALKNRIGYFPDIDKWFYDNETLSDQELFAKFKAEK